ncbi:MAG: thiol reductant ABC exporter subunit CydC [Acidiphilium sp.]|nr:thiol reductant ABC exporter subunit CydC [Acidiphilium sp.]MDD4935198.1 thiol reductant ABC exporter subunit CydC [Acidiphilium sp.]
MRDLIRLIRLYTPYRLWIAGGIALGLATVLANFGLLALSGWFIATAGVVGLAGFAAQNAFNFFIPAAGVRFFAMIRVLARYTGRLVDHEATFRLLAGLRQSLYAKLEPLAPAGLAGDRGGDLLGRLVADVDRLGDFFLRVVSPFAVAALGSLVMALVFATMSPLAGIVLLAGLVTAGVGLPLISLALGDTPSRDAVALQTAMRADLVDSVQGMAELLTYNAAPAMVERVDRASAALMARQGRLATIAGIGAGGTLLLANLTMAAMLLIGGRLVFAGHLAGPDLALLALGAMAAFEAVAPLPAAFQTLGGMKDSARRIFEIIDRDVPVAEPATSPARPERLDLCLSGVRLRYPGQTGWALDGIDLAMAPGEHLVILGRSGAGKTSLVNLLLRFAAYQEGSVKLGGVELRTIRGDDLRSLFTLVSQRTQIFAGSLRDNLLIAHPAAADAALWRALEIAQLAEFVNAQPEGLDALVGEAGAKLSGGEARRLSLARAALRDTPFLILDEPTEALDPLTEAGFRAALARIAIGRTVITITHRLAGIGPADRVVVFEAGRIVEDGPFAALESAGGTITRLARLQNRMARL